MAAAIPRPASAAAAAAAAPATKPAPPPDQGTGGAPAGSRWSRFWGPGQSQKVKSDVQGDAKRYGAKFGRAVHVSDPAGAIAAILVYALVINGIRYGTAGMTGWLRAKFLNEPMQGQASNALAPTTSGKTLSA